MDSLQMTKLSLCVLFCRNGNVQLENGELIIVILSLHFEP